MPAFGWKSVASLGPVVLYLAVGSTFSPSLAQEVHILEQSGTVISSANTACPPAETSSTIQLFETADLEDYFQAARADTAASCGTAGASGSLNSRITGSAIIVDMSCSSSLQGHRSSQGSARFSIEFEVISTVLYTMSAQGSFAYEDSIGYPTTTGWYFELVGIHQVMDSRPDVDVTWSGHLDPGTYVVEGFCQSNRVTLPNYDDIWWWADGWATLTGSLMLEFDGQVVVLTDRKSMGSLKALYR